MASATMSGVYAIRNSVDGRMYVGSTTRSINARWYEHRRTLRKGEHHSKFLQRSWTKYGEDCFEFIIVEIVEKPEHVLAREQAWMDHFQCFHKKRGFNMSPTAGNCAGRLVSDETRAKIAIAGTGRKASSETKALMSASRQGHPTSEETKEKIAAAHRGRIKGPHSPEHKAKISAGGKGMRRGAETRAKLTAVALQRTHSAESRARMSASAKNKQPETAQTREKRSNRLRELWATPEYRNAVLAAREAKRSAQMPV